MNILQTLQHLVTFPRAWWNRQKNELLRSTAVSNQGGAHTPFFPEPPNQPNEDEIDMNDPVIARMLKVRYAYSSLTGKRREIAMRTWTSDMHKVVHIRRLNRLALQTMSVEQLTERMGEPLIESTTLPTIDSVFQQQIERMGEPI